MILNEPRTGFGKRATSIGVALDRHERELSDAVKALLAPRIITRSWGVVTAEELISRVKERVLQ